jgi:Putative lumazine-binding
MTNHSKQTLDSVDAAAALEEQAVLAPIQALVGSAARRDKKAMLDVLLPDGGTAVVMNGKVLQFSLRGLVDRLPAGTRRIEERIYDPLIRIDNDIAMVWARYEFLIDGQVVQYGTDLFKLIHCDKRWLIAGIAYNSR